VDSPNDTDAGCEDDHRFYGEAGIRCDLPERPLWAVASQTSLRLTNLPAI
jgi:hypothetical protein